jgi:AAA domain
LDKSPGDSLLFKQSALRGVSYALTSYRAAVAATPTNGGIGFILKGSGIAALDLDDCRNEKTGKLDKWAADLVKSATGAYVEVTPSQKGVRILGLAGGKAVHTSIDMPTGKVELYRDAARYITVSGNEIGTCRTLINIDSLIDNTLATARRKDVSSSGVFHREVCRLASQGWSADEIEADMRGKPSKYARTKAAEYDDEGRLRREIDRCLRKIEVSDETGTFSIVPSAKFIADFVPPDYLLDGVLQKRFIYSLTGKTGSGKSAVTLMLSALVGGADGRLDERELAGGRVLYFAGENPDDIRMRWIVMGDLGFELNQLDVYFLLGKTKLTDDIERIRQRVEDLGGVDMIIVDTARSFFEGEDENNNKQMGDYARRLRTLCTVPGEPCVIVNCHPTKNAGADNLQPAGGGAFIAEMDGNLTCSKSRIIAEIHWQGKHRGPEFAPIRFELIERTSSSLIDSKGRKIRSVVATVLTQAGYAPRSKSGDDDLRKVVQTMREDDGISFEEIAEKLGWTQSNGKPAKSRVQRAMGKLVNGKFVKKSKGKLRLTSLGLNAEW